MKLSPFLQLFLYIYIYIYFWRVATDLPYTTRKQYYPGQVLSWRRNGRPDYYAVFAPWPWNNRALPHRRWGGERFWLPPRDCPPCCKSYEVLQLLATGEKHHSLSEVRDIRDWWILSLRAVFAGESDGRTLSLSLSLSLSSTRLLSPSLRVSSFSSPPLPPWRSYAFASDRCRSGFLIKNYWSHSLLCYQTNTVASSPPPRVTWNGERERGRGKMMRGARMHIFEESQAHTV